MTALSTFSVTTDAVGPGKVVINGEDVSDRIAGVAVVAEVGQPTIVTLRQPPAAGEISGEGIVRVRTQGAGDGVVEFLEAIDPKELERVTLGRLGGLCSRSPIAETLELLKEWARGS